MMHSHTLDTESKHNEQHEPKATSFQMSSTHQSSINNDVCYIMTKEIHDIRTPAAQTMVDNYHQSQAKSVEQFTHSSPLNIIRQNNPKTFDLLINYVSQFTEHIYAPLSQYLLSPHQLFKGDANGLIQQISTIYNHLKQRQMTPHHWLQIDLCARYDIASRISSDLDHDAVEWSYDDLDENVISCDTSSDDILKTESFVSSRSDENIEQIMKKCRMPLDDDNNYCYKRYEVLLYGEEIKSFEAVSNNSIPQCAFDNAPLCMIFNSTASAQQIFNERCTETAGLITVSFHVNYKGINVYLHTADGKGKLFGSRIFRDDLMSLIPLLFENSTVNQGIRNNINDLQLIQDDSYKNYYALLLKHIDAELDPLLESKLTEIASSWTDNISIIDTVKQCFIEHQITYHYFQNHTKKDFTQLLQRYNIKTGSAVKLWRLFIDNSNVKETKTNESLITNKTYLQQQQQIERLKQENDDLKQKNDDLKRVINAMSGTNESDEEMKQIGDDIPDMLIRSSSFSQNGPISNPVWHELGKNDTSLPGFDIIRGFHFSFQQSRYYSDHEKKQMIHQVLFVLYVLYFYQRVMDFLRMNQNH